MFSHQHKTLPAINLLLLLLAPAAHAHHGFGTFAIDETMDLSGTITKVEFVNPHAWLYFEAIGQDGQPQAWRCEMRAATVLRRSGWSKELFVPGETIQLTASPDRSDPRSCYLSTITFANGKTAERYGQLKDAEPVQLAASRPARLSSGEPNISGDWAPEQYVMADATGRSGGLVPLSVAQGDTAQDGPAGSPWRTSSVTYTPAGQQAADSFNLRSTDNPRMRCETTSIIFDWNFDGPVNRITQNADTIILQYGQLGLTRTVYMNADHPADIAASRAGHSTGHWENDELVVDTTGFAEGVLSPPVMNSPQLHVVERFSVDQDSLTLTREYAATDPVYYSDVYQGRDSMQIADIPYNPDPCSDYSLTTYEEQQQAESSGD